MANKYVLTVDPITKTINPARLPPSLANSITVVQTVDNVIPNRPTSSTGMHVTWQCWDDPGAKALANDYWRQVPAP